MGIFMRVVLVIALVWLIWRKLSHFFHKKR